MPLNITHTNKRISLNSKFVYFSNTPIAFTLRIHGEGNDSFKGATIQILRAPAGHEIVDIFITTTSTSSENLEIITSDIDIFSDIGIEDRAVLVDQDGVEYDARDVDKTMSIPSNAIAVRDTLLDTIDIDFTAHRTLLLAVLSSLDQALTYFVYGSTDNSKFFQLDTGTIADGSSTAQEKIFTITDDWAYIRITLKAGTNPTVGSYSVYQGIGNN